MKKFAKLYECDKLGQILVVRSEDELPEINFTMYMGDGGLLTSTLSYESVDLADEAFERVTYLIAKSIMGKAHDDMMGFLRAKH